MSSFVNKTFDNTDIAALTYQGGWFINGHWNATAFGDTGTLASTYDTACNVTFTFPEPAIAFYYWGFKNSIGALWGICIDCNPNNRSFIQIDGDDPTHNRDGRPLLLYSQTFKEPGIHQIILRNQPDPRFNGTSRITLDRFVIEIPVNNPATITMTVPSPTASSPSTAYSSQKKATPIGAILGSALGGSVLILFLLCLFFKFRPRRQKTSSVGSPFPALPPANHIPKRERKQDTTLNPPLAVTPPSVTATTAHNQPSSPRSLRPIREIDAGPANTTDDNRPGDVLPPEYTQVFP